MAETIQIPNNIPVSWLSRQLSADTDMLFLVSVPDTRTETQYMSKYFKHDDFCKALSAQFNMGFIQQWVNKLCSQYAPILDNQADNVLCCATIPNPYIISAIFQENCNITALSGYRLSTGMDIVFKNVKFDQICATNMYADGASITNLTSQNASITNLTSNSASITNLNVTNIHTATEVVPSLYGYPLNEVKINDNGQLVVKNKCVNFGVVDQDFDLVLDLVNTDELDGISKDFEVILTATSPCTMSLDSFNAYNQGIANFVTPNLDNDHVLYLDVDNDGEGYKTFLFIISQVDDQTMYINRQAFRNVRDEDSSAPDTGDGG